MSGTWYLYILRCADDTLYTGITTDVERRVREHNMATKGGARYTRARRPVTLYYVELAANRAEAARREAAVKKLPRTEKIQLARSADESLMASLMRNME